jgi:hypothetical protein
MSLNWQLTDRFNKTESNIHRWSPDGGQEQMHPKLNAFIWLTMVIGKDLTGGEKDIIEFKRRLSHLRQCRTNRGHILDIGRDEVKRNPSMWKETKDYGWKNVVEYRLTLEDVDAYWGVDTNASPLTPAKWNAKMIDILDGKFD